MSSLSKITDKIYNSRWWGSKIDNCNQFDFRFDSVIEIKTWEGIIVTKVYAKTQQFRIQETKSRNSRTKKKMFQLSVTFVLVILFGKIEYIL